MAHITATQKSTKSSRCTPAGRTRDTEFLEQLGADDRVTSQTDGAIAALEERGFPVLDTVRMHYELDSVASKNRAYLEMVRTMSVGVTQIIIHCGLADAELRSITKSSRIRSGDRDVFTDPSLIEEIRKANVELINWQQLHQMTSNHTQHSSE